MPMRIKLIASVSLLLVCLLSGSCAPTPDFDSRLSSIVKPYRFSIAQWESWAIPHEVNKWICGRNEKIDDKIGMVTEYFSLVEQVNAIRSEIEAINAGARQGDSATLEAELNRLEGQQAVLADAVERILEEQIKETLAEQGIFNPIDNSVRLKVNLPPLNFKLGKPPHLLVISPRDRIESVREITLRQNVSREEIEDIESKVDKLGVSSLVVELGGLGATYPSFVTNDAGLRFTTATATEEWLHQYLVFKPLGFLHLLDLVGLSRNYELATISETLASMVSKEISSMVCQKYYPRYENGASSRQITESEFDFNREMREIRKTVDKYLAQREIEQAEEFMEQKRQYLASRGYYIRKLNQAYFAFHGTYADSPTSISPIGVELKELRGQYTSLRDFLNTVAAMRSRQDLIIALNENK